MKIKISTKDIRFTFILALIVVATALFFNHTAKAESKPKIIKSHGKIVFNNNTEDKKDDVIFDADDIYHLYKICE